MSDTVMGLALDGGGVFGIGQAAILSKVDLSKFDFIAGTSVGSILAAMVAQGSKQDNLVPMFRELAPKVFAKPNFFAKLGFTPKYSDKVLNKALQSQFCGSFGDLHASLPTFVTAADLGPRQLKVFFSGDASDASWPIWEVCRAATAAETYFLPWKGYADGGIYANNPSAVLAAGMIRTVGLTSPRIKIVSIGTGGLTENEDTGSTYLWNLIQWGTYILDSLLGGGGNGMHEYLARSILQPGSFLRINFRRDPKWRFVSGDDMEKALVAWKPEIEAGIRAIEGF